MKTFKEYKDTEGLLEKLADIEHQQWMKWAKTLMEKETISKDRVERWNKLMVPYSELSDEMKEFDREYARLVIKVLEEIE